MIGRSPIRAARRHAAMNPFHRLVVMAFCAMPLIATAADSQSQKTAAADPVLKEVIAGDWRTPEQKARDQYRRPGEALTFWGLKPGMSVLEIQPGGASGGPRSSRHMQSAPAASSRRRALTLRTRSTPMTRRRRATNSRSTSRTMISTATSRS
jgi:hypothetical protein